MSDMEQEQRAMTSDKTRFLVWLEREPDPGFPPIDRPPSRVMDDSGLYWSVVRPDKPDGDAA